MIRIGFDGRALASPAAGMRRYTNELFGALAQLDPLLSIVAVGVPAGVAVPAGIELAGGAPSLPTNLGWMLTGLPEPPDGPALTSFTRRRTPPRLPGLGPLS